MPQPSLQQAIFAALDKGLEVNFSRGWISKDLIIKITGYDKNFQILNKCQIQLTDEDLTTRPEIDVIGIAIIQALNNFK